jgi:pimeloyl-ACP methyl ester carboxylesterase
MLVTDVLTKNRTPVLAKIDKTLLVVASSSSEELDSQKEMASRVPGADIVVIEDAGHAVFLDQPDAFANAQGSFLAGLESR